MRISLLVAAVVAGALCTKPAAAAITINMHETGGNVVFSYSGSLDISGLPVISGTDGGLWEDLLEPSDGIMIFGGLDLDVVGGGDPLGIPPAIIGPSTFGAGLLARPPDVFNSGDGFAIGFGLRLLVPNGYANGTEISGSMTYLLTDFTTLGIDADSAPYVWTVQNLAADTITLQVIPEPTSALFLCGSGALMGLRRRR